MGTLGGVEGAQLRRDPSTRAPQATQWCLRGLELKAAQPMIQPPAAKTGAGCSPAATYAAAACAAGFPASLPTAHCAAVIHTAALPAATDGHGWLSPQLLQPVPQPSPPMVLPPSLPPSLPPPVVAVAAAIAATHSCHRSLEPAVRLAKPTQPPIPPS